MLIEVDGVPMGARVASALGAPELPVAMVGGSVEVAERLGLVHVPDILEGEGPLIGVWSALAHFGGDVMVAACDLPDLDAGTVALIKERDVESIDAVVAVVDGRRQPSLARWCGSSLDTIADSVRDGERSLLGALDRLRVREVVVRSSAMLNANRPDQLSGRLKCPDNS